MYKMNSYEVIKNTINFQKPDRLGVDYFLGDRWLSDICLQTVEYPDTIRNRRIADNLELWEDEWNNTWARIATDKTTKGEVYKGALESWSQLESYILPDLANTKFYDNVKKCFSDAAGKYKLGGLPGFNFSIARKLRRLDNFLMDIKLEIENVIELMHRIESLLFKMMVQYAQAGADGVFFCEDWGTQERLLISPADWQELFKPSFERLCEVARRNKLTVWMHSCGYIYETIPHLIDVGIKVLQLDQPELMGIERLGEEFGGKVTFWSPCDIQKILPTGDKILIENSVRRMVQHLAVKGGGLIAKSYGNSLNDLQSIGVKPEWSQFAHKCFMKYGNEVFHG
jgi:hypothetical protein